MQMVILAGGVGSRLGPLTQELPKAMIPVHGKPFLEYQIELLKRSGITDLVLCVGHLSWHIISYFGDGERFGVRVKYSMERDRLLGTGGALKQAVPLLDDVFFVMYGDSYLMLNYQAIASYFGNCKHLGLMVVYRNENRYDRSNVAVSDGLVTFYDTAHQRSDLIYIDEGLSILRKDALALIPSGEFVALGRLFQVLIAQKTLIAYETQQRFYEIGSLSGLEEFSRLVASRDLSVTHDR